LSKNLIISMGHFKYSGYFGQQCHSHFSLSRKTVAVPIYLSLFTKTWSACYYLLHNLPPSPNPHKCSNNRLTILK
jgi:hypothetical protein